MPAKQGANVNSIEALDAFRAELILYMSKATPALEEISAEILRMRLWLENDQTLFWQSQVRKRTLALEMAKSDLFSAQMSNLKTASSAEVAAVRRAEKALEEAQNKLTTVKRWIRNFSSQVDPIARQLEKLQTIVSVDLPRAEVYLSQVVKTLDDYAAITSTLPSVASPPPSEESAADNGKTPSGEKP